MNKDKESNKTSNIKEEVYKLVDKYNFFEIAISNDTVLDSDFGIDSLVFFSLLSDLEENFKISFKIEELFGCKKIKSLCDLIEKKLKEN